MHVPLLRRVSLTWHTRNPGVVLLAILSKALFR